MELNEILEASIQKHLKDENAITLTQSARNDFLRIAVSSGLRGLRYTGGKAVAPRDTNCSTAVDMLKTKLDDMVGKFITRGQFDQLAQESIAEKATELSVENKLRFRLCAQDAWEKALTRQQKDNHIPKRK